MKKQKILPLILIFVAILFLMPLLQADVVPTTSPPASGASLISTENYAVEILDAKVEEVTNTEGNPVKYMLSYAIKIVPVPDTTPLKIDTVEALNTLIQSKNKDDKINGISVKLSEYDLYYERYQGDTLKMKLEDRQVSKNPVFDNYFKDIIFQSLLQKHSILLQDPKNSQTKGYIYINGSEKDSSSYLEMKNVFGNTPYDGLLKSTILQLYLDHIASSNPAAGSELIVLNSMQKGKFSLTIQQDQTRENTNISFDSEDIDTLKLFAVKINDKLKEIYFKSLKHGEFEIKGDQLLSAKLKTDGIPKETEVAYFLPPEFVVYPKQGKLELGFYTQGSANPLANGLTEGNYKLKLISGYLVFIPKQAIFTDGTTIVATADKLKQIYLSPDSELYYHQENYPLNVIKNPGVEGIALIDYAEKINSPVQFDTNWRFFVVKQTTSNIFKFNFNTVDIEIGRGIGIEKTASKSQVLSTINFNAAQKEDNKIISKVNGKAVAVTLKKPSDLNPYLITFTTGKKSVDYKDFEVPITFEIKQEQYLLNLIENAKKLKETLISEKIEIPDPKAETKEITSGAVSIKKGYKENEYCSSSSSPFKGYACKEFLVDVKKETLEKISKTKNIGLQEFSDIQADYLAFKFENTILSQKDNLFVFSELPSLNLKYKCVVTPSCGTENNEFCCDGGNNRRCCTFIEADQKWGEFTLSPGTFSFFRRNTEALRCNIQGQLEITEGCLKDDSCKGSTKEFQEKNPAAIKKAGGLCKTRSTELAKSQPKPPTTPLRPMLPDFLIPYLSTSDKNLITLGSDFKITGYYTPTSEDFATKAEFCKTVGFEGAGIEVTKEGTFVVNENCVNTGSAYKNGPTRLGTDLTIFRSIAVDPRSVGLAPENLARTEFSQYLGHVVKIDLNCQTTACSTWESSASQYYYLTEDTGKKIESNRIDIYTGVGKEAKALADSITDQAGTATVSLGPKIDPAVYSGKGVNTILANNLIADYKFPETEVLSWPIHERFSKITDYYGVVSAIRNYKAHGGIDVGGQGKNLDGENVYPVYNGIVRTNANNKDSGNFIVIQHTLAGRTIYSGYAHLKEKSDIPVGAPVTTETIIGQVGSTGNSKAPHLHLALSASNKEDETQKGDSLNPLCFFSDKELIEKNVDYVRTIDTQKDCLRSKKDMLDLYATPQPSFGVAETFWPASPGSRYA